MNQDNTGANGEFVYRPRMWGITPSSASSLRRNYHKRSARRYLWLRTKVRVLNAVVYVIDGIDHQVLLPLGRLLTAVREPINNPVWNVLVNVSLDLMGLAARLEESAFNADSEILKLNRLDLDVTLAKEQLHYHEVMELCQEAGDDQGMDHADIDFNQAVDDYAWGVEVLVFEHKRLNEKYRRGG